MTRMASAGVVLLMLAAAPLAAQDDGIASRVIGGLDTKMVQPECKLDGGDFRVSSGKTYLKTAIETSEQSNKTRAVQAGIRVVIDALTEGKLATKSAGAWYWLGRLYLQHGDVLGTDSAFARAQAMAPDCKQDIGKYRYRAWVSLYNAGNGFRQQKNDDSAAVMYRAANSIHRDSPLAYINLADIFSQRQLTDSALYYFGQAAATEPTDGAQIRARNQAVFNQGVLLLNNARAPEAVVAFRRYIRLEPEDVAGKKALAQAFRAAEMVDSAQALEHELVSTVTVGGEESEVSEGDLFDIAVRQFNDKDYREAAETFGRITSRNPWNRDALFNQANAYLALQDGPNLASTAEKLLAIEPFSEHDYSLLAQGHKLAGNQDGTFKAIVAREGLLVNIESDGLKRTADGITFTASVTGREARDENNKLLENKPLTLTVDFLGEGGTVVSSKDVSIPVLKPGEKFAVSATGTGEGIRAWRYKAH